MYVVRVSLRPCSCPPVHRDPRESRSLRAATESASAIWTLILTFWADAPIGATVEVIDGSDGQVIWRNGRQVSKEKGLIDGT